MRPCRRGRGRPADREVLVAPPLGIRATASFAMTEALVVTFAPHA